MSFCHYSLFLEIFLGAFGVFQLGFIFRWIYLEPERATFDTEEMFHQVTKYFEAPIESEQLKITVVS